jgi:hypothetical protein
VFEIEPLSSSLRLGNMVGGLGWLRRRVRTWWRTLFLEVTDIWLSFFTFENFASHATDATRRDKAWDRAGKLRLVMRNRTILVVVLIRHTFIRKWLGSECGFQLDQP